MPELSLPSRIQIVLAMAALLGACGKPAAGNSARVDFTDVTARNALSRVDALERRIAELEGKVERNKKEIDAAFSDAEADRKAANRNVQLLNAFKIRMLSRLDRIEGRLALDSPD